MTMNLRSSSKKQKENEGGIQMTPEKRRNRIEEEKFSCLGYDYSFGSRNKCSIEKNHNELMSFKGFGNFDETIGLFETAQPPFQFEEADLTERALKETQADAAARRRSKRLVFSPLDRDDISLKISKKLFTEDLQFKRSNLGFLQIKEFEPQIQKKIKQF